MKYLVTPKTARQHPAMLWVDSTEATLDGYFYDHLCKSTGAIVGVRYWVDQAIAFDRHPVFGQFVDDKRFKFNQREGYVDIVFDEVDIDAFRGNALHLETVQDFGGDGVVKLGDAFGITFNL